MPLELRAYQPADWCEDLADVLQVRYHGVHAYTKARARWFMENRGMSRDQAHRAARDSTAAGVMLHGWGGQRGSA